MRWSRKKNSGKKGAIKAFVAGRRRGFYEGNMHQRHVMGNVTLKQAYSRGYHKAKHQYQDSAERDQD
jgi:hypothetical protein